MENAIDKGIEIDSNYGLIQVFNYINQDQKSRVFVYQGVQFWRQDFQFIMSYNGKQFIAGDILYLDEFIQMLKDQKRGEEPL
jgi:hypothetical protein